MCDPTTAGVVAVMGAATLYSAQQQNAAGKSQQGYYNYMASLSEKNKEMAMAQGEENAYYAQEEGLRELKDFKEKTKRFSGTQRASIAASGIQGRTVEDIILDTQTEMSKDELAIMYNTEMNIYQARKQADVQAGMLQQQAHQYRYQGAMAAITGQMQSFGTLLSGGAQTAMTGVQLYRQSSNSGAKTTNTQSQQTVS